MAFVVLTGGILEPFLPVFEQPVGAQPTFQSILEVESTARLLAILLDSGRNVIDENQALFDNPEKGEKGFTPDVFEARLREVFRLRSGVDLGELDSNRLAEWTKDLIRKLVQVSKQIVREAQPEINRQGIGFKGFIPAVFGSRVATRYYNVSGILMGQRALAPRNPSNKPDPFERAALLEFADPAYPREKVITEVTGGSHQLRLMLPLYATRGCLECHGEPKGAIDKTGYPREGFQLGQNAGGISVIIPIQEK
jgi:general secretion pathway protein A